MYGELMFEVGKLYIDTHPHYNLVLRVERVEADEVYCELISGGYKKDAYHSNPYYRYWDEEDGIDYDDYILDGKFILVDSDRVLYQEYNPSVYGNYQTILQAWVLNV
jgi:hypothetical protein